MIRADSLRALQAFALPNFWGKNDDARKGNYMQVPVFDKCNQNNCQWTRSKSRNNIFIIKQHPITYMNIANCIHYSLLTQTVSLELRTSLHFSFVGANHDFDMARLGNTSCKLDLLVAPFPKNQLSSILSTHSSLVKSLVSRDPRNYNHILTISTGLGWIFIINNLCPKLKNHQP